MTENIHKHRILILDFGSQYTQLVARRVRELGVYCELWAWDVTEAQIRDFNPSGIILSGGPESTTEENSPRAPQYVFEAGVPVFGVCYGMQTMAMQLGGHVEASNEREFGYAQVEVVNDSALLQIGCAAQTVNRCWTSVSHGDKLPPPGFVCSHAGCRCLRPAKKNASMAYSSTGVTTRRVCACWSVLCVISASEKPCGRQRKLSTML
ncbi:MAG: glutamine amidotransferase-related protein [Escherichia coli]